MRLFIGFLPWQLASCPPIWELVFREGASKPVPAQLLLQVLCLNLDRSSAICSYLQLLEGSQGLWQNPMLIWESIGLSWPTRQGEVSLAGHCSFCYIVFNSTDALMCLLYVYFSEGFWTNTFSSGFSCHLSIIHYSSHSSCIALTTLFLSEILPLVPTSPLKHLSPTITSLELLLFPLSPWIFYISWLL